MFVCKVWKCKIIDSYISKSLVTKLKRPKKSSSFPHLLCAFQTLHIHRHTNTKYYYMAGATWDKDSIHLSIFGLSQIPTHLPSKTNTRKIQIGGLGPSLGTSGLPTANKPTLSAWSFGLCLLMYWDMVILFFCIFAYVFFHWFFHWFQVHRILYICIFFPASCFLCFILK